MMRVSIMIDNSTFVHAWDALSRLFNLDDNYECKRYYVYDVAT